MLWVCLGLGLMLAFLWAGSPGVESSLVAISKR